MLSVQRRTYCLGKRWLRTTCGSQLSNVQQVWRASQKRDEGVETWENKTVKNVERDFYD